MYTFYDNMRLLFDSLKELLPETQHRALCFRAVLKRYQAYTGKSRFPSEVFTPRNGVRYSHSNKLVYYVNMQQRMKIQILIGRNKILTDCTQS